MDPIRVVRFERAAYEAELTSEDECERQQLKQRFPHSAALEGAFPEYFFATRWCWQNFGACDGECHEMYSEYPGCPLVLKTGWIKIVRGRNVM